MNASGKDSKLVAEAYSLAGMLIAVIVWIVIVVSVVRLLGLDPEGPIEDIIGTSSPFVVGLIAIPNAMLVAFFGILFGRMIQKMVIKFEK